MKYNLTFFMIMACMVIFAYSTTQVPDDSDLWDNFFKSDKSFTDSLGDNAITVEEGDFWWNGANTTIGQISATYNIMIFSKSNQDTLIIDFSSDTLRVYGGFPADSAAKVFIDELISEYDHTIKTLKMELEKCRKNGLE